MSAATLPRSLWADLWDHGRAHCPRCHTPAPGWRWVELDGLDRPILTHDGNRICPRDPVWGCGA